MATRYNRASEDDVHGQEMFKAMIQSPNHEQVNQSIAINGVHRHENVLITGLTGCGKTYVACALGEQACQQHIQVVYYRLTRLLDDLNIGHADGSYQKQLLHLSKKDLLILDDWGLEKLNTRQASDLLEVMEDRYQRGSTIIISQLPVSEWYKLVGNPTVSALRTCAPDNVNSDNPHITWLQSDHTPDSVPALQARNTLLSTSPPDERLPGKPEADLVGSVNMSSPDTYFSSRVKRDSFHHYGTLRLCPRFNQRPGSYPADTNSPYCRLRNQALLQSSR